MQWVVCDVDFIKQVIISIVNKLLDGEGCIRKAPPPSLAKRSVKPRYVSSREEARVSWEGIENARYY
jgi:hypothetical protein